MLMRGIAVPDDMRKAAFGRPRGALKFALVVADRQMPGMDGTRFLALVKERYPDTVRMMLTGIIKPLIRKKTTTPTKPQFT